MVTYNAIWFLVIIMSSKASQSIKWNNQRPSIIYSNNEEQSTSATTQYEYAAHDTIAYVNKQKTRPEFITNAKRIKLNVHQDQLNLVRHSSPNLRTESSSHILHFPRTSNHNHPNVHFDPSKSCSVSYDGQHLHCYSVSRVYVDKIKQLRRRGMLSHEMHSSHFSSCDLVEDQSYDFRKRRKRRSISIRNSTLIKGSYSHSYPTYERNMVEERVTGSDDAHVEHAVITSEEDETSEETLNRCFLEAGLSVMKPYHMYNINGEVRFIVQEDHLHISQCQPKATCSFVSLEPLPLKNNCAGGTRLSARFHCERRLCTHQLLSFDPSDLTKFIFFDEFPFECCCRCELNPLAQPIRPCY